MPDDEPLILDNAQVDVENGVQRIGDRGKLSDREVRAARLHVRDVRVRGVQALRKLRLRKTGLLASLADRPANELGCRVRARGARHDALFSAVHSLAHVQPLDDRFAGRRQPNARQLSGRGLWIAHEPCDLVQARSSEHRLQQRGADQPGDRPRAA